MKTYRIPVTWQSWAMIEIRAKNLKEAKKKVIEPGVHLPKDAEYIDDSFQIDEESELMPKE